MRDSLMWLYGTGFPKSLDVSKALDKAAGARREVVGKSARHVSGKAEQRTVGLNGSATFAERVGMGQFITAPATDLAKRAAGWGTALKPAHEPILLARKPLAGTVAATFARYGTGGINVDGCRLETSENLNGGAYATRQAVAESPSMGGGSFRRGIGDYSQPTGRWPANVILDEEAARALDEQSGERRSTLTGRADPSTSHTHPADPSRQRDSMFGNTRAAASVYADPGGGASRFFYCPKSSRAERGEGNDWPTVKPLALMRWLCRLVTPPGGVVLDPFHGSGSTLLAARAEGFRSIGIDQDAHAREIAEKRLAR